MTRLTLLFFTLVWSSQTVRAENLVVFGDDSYPPVVYSKDGEVTGFLTSILAKLEPITGDHYDIRLYPWKRAYELAYRGEGGVIGLSYTEERATHFDYSQPVYHDNIQVVTLKERVFPFEQLSDLQGKVIGGVIGATQGSGG